MFGRFRALALPRHPGDRGNTVAVCSLVNYRSGLFSTAGTIPAFLVSLDSQEKMIIGRYGTRLGNRLEMRRVRGFVFLLHNLD